MQTQIKQLLLFTFSFLLFSSSLHSQILEPVKWDFQSKDLGDGVYELTFKASIDPGWTVYSQHTDPEDGPVPTEIFYDTESGFELIGDAVESGHKKEGPDPYFDNAVVIKYLSDEPFVIKQKVKVLQDNLKLLGYVESMACDDSKCLPPNPVDFEFDLANTSKSSKAAAAPIAKTGKKQVKWNKLEKEGPVGWEVALFPSTGKDEYMLSLKGTIDEGWATYSYYTEEGGPVPTTIDIEEPSDVEFIGNPVEFGQKKEAPEPLFENITVVKFLPTSKYTISQKIKWSGQDELKGYLTYMACNDKQCTIPISVDFSINSDGSTAVAVAPTNTGSGGELTNINGDIIDQVRPALVESYENPIGQCGEENVSSNSILWMFIFGFGGGLLALLTPCVFPMIPLTVSYFTKDTKRKAWMNGLIYGLSIVVIYVVMGLAITAIFGEEALNRLSTNWIANTLFFVIFIIFAFSFFGFFEITLPSSWSTRSDQMADKGGLIGIFFMAFTLALVSFSCTGPIIGTAIVQAASNQVGPAVVMTGFALALAIPFGLFAIFPAWLNSLPRSGSWMSSVKVVLGFLELALALKFLSVADMTNHWGFLKYELFLGLWILIAALMTLYLFGFIKFPHDSPIKKLSNSRKIFATSSLLLTLFLCTGFMVNPQTDGYNSLKLLSGIAPPAHYNFFKPSQEVNADIKSKYKSFSKCANNIDCFKDYYEGLAFAREQNKPVFLDMTGHGCVNCRKTEEHIWVDDRIRKKLSEDFVMVSLYVDDDKKLEKPLVSKSRNKKIRNIGNKWADFQIVNFQQNSQPLYIMMSPGEQVLSAPRGYRDGIEDYNDYLECGLNTYNTL